MAAPAFPSTAEASSNPPLMADDFSGKKWAGFVGAAADRYHGLDCTIETGDRVLRRLLSEGQQVTIPLIGSFPMRLPYRSGVRHVSACSTRDPSRDASGSCRPSSPAPVRCSKGSGATRSRR